MKVLLALALLLLAAAPAQSQPACFTGPFSVGLCPSPTPTASPAPTAAPVIGAPYGPNSPWNLKVSASPSIASYSATVIAGQFARGNTQPIRNQEAGPFDYGHPVYVASANDPLVKLVCNQFCSPNYPISARIPAKARPAGGSDAHLAVIQPDGTEIDFWALYGTPGRDWQTGDTATAGNVANCGSYASGSGFAAGVGATAGEACLGAGVITAQDLLSGQISHALFLIAQCAIGTQYPTPTSASTDKCTSGVGPPLGGRLWYDQVAPSNLKPWEQAILNALHTYGGYLMDDVGGGASVSGIAFLMQSGEQTYAFGLPNPFAGLAVQGWSPLTIPTALELRWIGADPWNPAGLATHMKWLAPCSAQAQC